MLFRKQTIFFCIVVLVGISGIFLCSSEVQAATKYSIKSGDTSSMSNAEFSRKNNSGAAYYISGSKTKGFSLKKAYDLKKKSKTTQWVIINKHTVTRSDKTRLIYYEAYDKNDKNKKKVLIWHNYLVTNIIKSKSSISYANAIFNRKNNEGMVYQLQGNRDKGFVLKKLFLLKERSKSTQWVVTNRVTVKKPDGKYYNYYEAYNKANTSKTKYLIWNGFLVTNTIDEKSKVNYDSAIFNRKNDEGVVYKLDGDRTKGFVITKCFDLKERSKDTEWVVLDRVTVKKTDGKYYNYYEAYNNANPSKTKYLIWNGFLTTNKLSENSQDISFSGKFATEGSTGQLVDFVGNMSTGFAMKAKHNLVGDKNVWIASKLLKVLENGSTSETIYYKVANKDGSLSGYINSKYLVTRTNKENPVIFSHRGGSADTQYPEHTFAAYNNAIQVVGEWNAAHPLEKTQSVNLEMDLQLTKDGKLYVSHDDSLLRMAHIDKKFSEVTSEELDAKDEEGNYLIHTDSFDGAPKGEKIHSLEEVLTQYGNSVNYVIELKNDGSVDEMVIEFQEELASMTQNVLQKTNRTSDSLYNHIIVQSFCYPALSQVRSSSDTQFNKMTTLALMMMADKDSLPDLLTGTYKHDVDIIGASTYYVSPKWVKPIQEAGKKVFFWTLNSVSDLDYAKYINADGYFTDYTLEGLTEAAF